MFEVVINQRKKDGSVIQAGVQKYDDTDKLLEFLKNLQAEHVHRARTFTDYLESTLNVEIIHVR